MTLLTVLAQFDPSQAERLGVIGLLATGCVALAGMCKLLWNEIGRLREKYDRLMDTSHACIAQNTATLSAVREEIAMSRTLQRLEERLADAPAALHSPRK
jgi:hypothetical protein